MNGVYMPCTQPLEAFLPLDFDIEGKRKLIFSPKKLYEFKRSTVIKLEKYGILPKFDEHNLDIYDDTHKFPEIYHKKDISSECPDGYIIQVPCGKCLGCRLDYSRLWATRSVNEAYFCDYYRNCAFVSLTFNDNTLRDTYLGYSLDKAFFRSWIKRLRFAVKSEYGVEFRIMACGEYGSKRGRPHYHMILFGFNFPDKYIFAKKTLNNGKVITTYRSPFLEKIWKLPHSSESCGYSMIEDVNYQACAYVARYVTKKMHPSHYGGQQPEFLLTSRMPGLGYKFCETFLKDIFTQGFVVLPDGFKSPIPRYYESICEKLDPVLLYNYKYEKFHRLYENMLQNFKSNNNPSIQRYSVLSELNSLRLNKLPRTYEIDVSD